MKTQKRIRNFIGIVAVIAGIIILISCKKNDYGIAPYTRPVSSIVPGSSNSIFDDTTRLRFIPNDGNWDPHALVYEDLQYDAYLTRFAGWNGGDGNYSHLLPDSTILWTFQDSFFGTITSNRNRNPSTNAFVRNAGVIQKNRSTSNFTQLNQGNLNNSQTWIQYDNLVSNDTKQIYWPGGGHVLNGTFQILLGHMSYNTSGGLDFASVDLAIYSLPGMTLQKVIKNKYMGGVNFDSNIYDDADGYTYIYGNTSASFSYKLQVARVPNHDLTANWQYLTKNGWADNYDGNFVLQDSQTLPNIVKSGSKYYLVSQGWGYGHEIFIWESPSPTGPFTNRRTIYMIPNNQKVVTYNMTVHSALAEEGELVIAYNINPISFGDNFNLAGSADLYRPYFVRIKNWQ